MVAVLWTRLWRMNKGGERVMRASETWGTRDMSHADSSEMVDCLPDDAWHLFLHRHLV